MERKRLAQNKRATSELEKYRQMTEEELKKLGDEYIREHFWIRLDIRAKSGMRIITEGSMMYDLTDGEQPPLTVVHVDHVKLVQDYGK